MKLVGGIALGLLALLISCGVGGYMYYRNSAIDHVQATTGIEWPKGSSVISVDQTSSFNSDHTKVVVEIPADVAYGFLIDVPLEESCSCVKGNIDGPVMRVWSVTYDHGSRRLTEVVDGYW